MKKLFLFALIATMALSSCKVKEAVEKFYHDKCADSKVTKLPNGKYRVAIKCTGLYETVEVKKYLEEGKVSFDFVNAEASGVVVSEDSIPNMIHILKKISKGVK